MTNIGRIRVVRESDDLMDCGVICPHCGATTDYGSLRMVDGVYCCPLCHEQLYKTIEFDRANNYEAYVRKANNHLYEPYALMEEKE